MATRDSSARANRTNCRQDSKKGSAQCRADSDNSKSFPKTVLFSVIHALAFGPNNLQLAGSDFLGSVSNHELKARAGFHVSPHANEIITFNGPDPIQFRLDIHREAEIVHFPAGQVHDIVKPVRQRVGGRAIEYRLAIVDHLSGPRSPRVIFRGPWRATVDTNATNLTQSALRNPKFELLHRLGVHELKSHRHFLVDIKLQQVVKLLDKRHGRFLQVHKQIIGNGSGGDFHMEMNGGGNRHRVEFWFLFKQAGIIQVPANATGFQRSFYFGQGFVRRVGHARELHEAFRFQLFQSLYVRRTEPTDTNQSHCQRSIHGRRVPTTRESLGACGAFLASSSRLW